MSDDFVFSNFLFIYLISKNGAFCDIMCRNNVAPDSAHGSVIRRIRFICWVTNATDTHPENVTLLFHDNSGYTNAPQSCIRTLALFYDYKLDYSCV
jgi:hypothetical protein